MSTIIITSDMPALRLKCLLGPDGAKVTGGYGGWGVTDRPRRVGITQFDGRAPFGMTLQIILDGWRAGRPIEQDCVTLERMALPPSLGEDPPVVRISGAIPHEDLTWGINGLDWDLPIRRIPDGLRMRQGVMLTLLAIVRVDSIQTTAAGRARDRVIVGGKAPIDYVVGQGETLSTIAASRLGDSKRWKEIGDLNGIRDPKAVKPGQHVKVPQL